jgi:DNA topoisomerase-3
MEEGQQVMQRPLGKCPACGGEIIEGKKGFGCKNWREQDGACRFVIWKEIGGRKVTPDMLETLLAGDITPVMSFRSREGKEFSASLKVELDEKEGRWTTRFIFGASPGAGGGEGEAGDGSGAPMALGKCPRCGAEVVEGTKGFGCKNWREQDGGCRFVIWKVIAGKEIPEAAVRDLLTKGETTVIHGFISKKGREFSAKLRLEGDDHKTTFVF